MTIGGCHCGYIAIQEDGKWLGFNEIKNHKEIFDFKVGAKSYVKYA